MTLQTYARFLPDSEATDGKGWALTHWDDAVIPPVTTVEYFHALTNPDVLTYTVTNKALTSNVATLTIGTHTFAVGQIVSVTGVDAVFNGVYAITAIAATTISYARTNANVASTAATGAASVAIHKGLSAVVTNKALTSNVATLTTQGPHGFTVGQRVTVAITDTVFDGDFLITAVTSTTFSYAKTNANVTSAAATGTATIPKSLVERLRELMSADASIQAYFLAKAQTDFLASGGNPATVTTNRNALLVGEGLVPPA